MNRKKSKFRTIANPAAVLLILFLFSGAVNCPANRQDAETEITIFHINDAHSRIDNFARIAYLIKKEKQENPNVFFVNAGDNFSGNPIVDQYEPKGEPMRAVLNLSGTDVLTLGNHEFDYGQELLKKFMQEANFPIICANIAVPAGAIIPQPKPYVILKTKEGIRIALLGLVQISRRTGIPSTHPAKIKGLTFSYGVDTAKNYRFLKDKSDVFIALSHLGYMSDEKLAREMGELDIIIGGHSHTLMVNPVTINDVLITQAGSYARYLGRVDITIKNGKITGKKSSLIKVDDIKGEIPGIKEKITAFNNNPRLNRVLTTLPGPVKGEDLLGNLITDALRKVHHLDIGIHNRGGTRSGRLPKDVRLKDIYTLLPFGNDIVSIEMTPAEIEGIFRYDFERFNHVELYVSGITYTVKHTAQKRFISVDVRLMNGKPLDKNKTYKVGINDYLVSAYKFKHRDAGKSLDTTIAETFIQYLQQEKHPH